MSGIKDKLLGASGSATGILGFLGGYQVCHNACLALVTFLTFLGFTVAGMPLLFLTRVAIPFWSVAVVLLITMTLLKYVKMSHLSTKMLILNSGLIIAGVPFQQVQEFNYIFWIIGGTLILFSIGWYFYEKINQNKKELNNRS